MSDRFRPLGARFSIPCVGRTTRPMRSSPPHLLEYRAPRQPCRSRRSQCLRRRQRSTKRLTRDEARRMATNLPSYRNCSSVNGAVWPHGAARIYLGFICTTTIRPDRVGSAAHERGRDENPRIDRSNSRCPRGRHRPGAYEQRVQEQRSCVVCSNIFRDAAPRKGWARLNRALTALTQINASGHARYQKLLV